MYKNKQENQGYVYHELSISWKKEEKSAQQSLKNIKTCYLFL